MSPSVPIGCAIDEVSDGVAPGCDAVREWLREFNWERNGAFMASLGQPEHQAQPLILLATDSADGTVVGGLFAETQFAWLKISIMAVKPEWRSRGVGRTLLAKAEHAALLRGCRHSYVDTMEFQAPEFYRKHGYQVAGTLADWDSSGHAKLFFTKDLNGGAGTI